MGGDYQWGRDTKKAGLLVSCQVAGENDVAKFVSDTILEMLRH